MKTCYQKELMDVCDCYDYNTYTKVDHSLQLTISATWMTIRKVHTQMAGTDEIIRRPRINQFQFLNSVTKWCSLHFQLMHMNSLHILTDHFALTLYYRNMCHRNRTEVQRWIVNMYRLLQAMSVSGIQWHNTAAFFLFYTKMEPRHLVFEDTFKQE